jgi:hypothetical protein
MVIPYIAVCSSTWEKSISRKWLVFTIYKILTDIISSSLLLSAITFSEHRGFANLSRVDPAKISCTRIQPYFHYLRGGGQIVFTTVIVVDECRLIEPAPIGNARPVKSISGGIFEGEYERFTGAVGMIIGSDLFAAQFAMDILSFQTALFSERGQGMCFICS